MSIDARFRRWETAGFTLVELAVALAIIAFLLTMLIVPLGTQIDQQRNAETQAQLDQIREAIIGFALANGRLPCPASPTIPITTAGAGTENASCAGPPNSQGVIPWATLGVPETDAWGRRFTYRVTPSFAAPTGGQNSIFLLTDNGDITVTNGSTNIATYIPAIIISHGKNGLGSYGTDGTQRAGASGDEAINATNATSSPTFVSRTNAPDFDDLVVWISPNVLKARMVAAGRLP